MRRFIATTFGLLLFLPGAAWAGTWVNCMTGFTMSALAPGVSACYRDWSDDPVRLDTVACENQDVQLYMDRNGSGSESDATAALYTCPGPDAITTLSAGCQPLDNGTTLNATAPEAFGIGADYLWADVLDAATQDPELRVRCAQPSRP